jgi:hypothetical protein
MSLGLSQMMASSSSRPATSRFTRTGRRHGGCAQPEQHGRNVPSKPLTCMANFRAGRFDIRYSGGQRLRFDIEESLASWRPFQRLEKLSKIFQTSQSIASGNTCLLIHLIG